MNCIDCPCLVSNLYRDMYSCAPNVQGDREGIRYGGCRATEKEANIVMEMVFVPDKEWVKRHLLINYIGEIK